MMILPSPDPGVMETPTGAGGMTRAGGTGTTITGPKSDHSPPATRHRNRRKSVRRELPSRNNVHWLSSPSRWVSVYVPAVAVSMVPSICVGTGGFAEMSTS